jgi:hypothetical protein
MNEISKKAFERMLASADKNARYHAVRRLGDLNSVESFEMVSNHFKKESDQHVAFALGINIYKWKSIPSSQKRDLLISVMEKTEPSEALGHLAIALEEEMKR